MLSPVRLLVLCCFIGAIKVNVSDAQNTITADFDRSSDIEVQESDGFAEVCVVLSGSLDSTASFRVNANSEIDAMPGEDFEALDLVILSFEAGELRKCIDITIIEDGLEEGSEPEYIALQLLPDSFSGQDDIDINVRLYQVAILDSDVLLLGFTQTNYEVVEAETQAVCVRIVDGSLASGVDLGVIIQINDGTGLDRTLLISPDPDAMNCVDITIFEDQIIEAMQLLTLTLQEDNVPVLFEGTATFHVDDNDRAEVELQDTEFQLLEGDFGTQVDQEVCIVLVDDLGGLKREIVLNITASSDDVDATLGADYGQLNMNLTFPIGSLVDHEVCFQFTIIGDNLREEDESFSIMLVPITLDTIVGGSVVNVIIMEDNDLNDCRTLEIENGVVSQTSTIIVGDVATYTCDENFYLIPNESASRTCMSNGWSGQDPVCHDPSASSSLSPSSSTLVIYVVTALVAMACVNCSLEAPPKVHTTWRNILSKRSRGGTSVQEEATIYTCRGRGWNYEAGMAVSDPIQGAGG